MNSVAEKMKAEELKALKKTSEQAYRDYLSRLQQKEMYNREKYKNELDQCDELQKSIFMIELKFRYTK